MNVKFHKNCENTGKILKISCVPSVSLWNLTFIFSGSHTKYCRWLITSLALENVKKNAILYKLFWYKVFVHWKLKLLNFLVNSALIIFSSISFRDTHLTILFLSKRFLSNGPVGHKIESLHFAFSIARGFTSLDNLLQRSRSFFNGQELC